MTEILTHSRVRLYGDYVYFSGSGTGARQFSYVGLITESVEVFAVAVTTASKMTRKLLKLMSVSPL